MRRAALVCVLCIVFAVFWTGPPVSGASGELVALKYGAQGVEVYEVQNWLYALGFLKAPPDGQYGKATADAVLSFQAYHRLAADGVVGPATRSALRREVVTGVFGFYIPREGDTLDSVARRFSVDAAAIAELNRIEDSVTLTGNRLILPQGYFDPGRDAFRSELVDWTEASTIYRDNSIARVIDLASGRSFLVRRRGGHFHADSEPLTQADTVTMKEIVGGTWSWNRRAIIVEARGRWLAASMNGMPHGGEQVARNGFLGHFCIHFLGSKIHSSGKEDPLHQQMVLRAAKYGR